MDAQLITEVETFLQKTGMSASRFGDAALGDRHFVRQIRNGRRVWPETEKRVRQFIATYRSETAQAAA